MGIIEPLLSSIVNGEVVLFHFMAVEQPFTCMEDRNRAAI